ncbi:MAG: SpoIID/LytB domain-containing protein, partial [Acidobacteria bacterium]|nr:SpoIID/LytB domain-containing protein [Acidobacteriota bacterium]
MKRGFLIVFLVPLCGIAPASAQDVRVELFSKTPARQIALRAGKKAVTLCAAAGKQPCLVVKSGTQAICTVAKAGVRCESSVAAKQFERVFASSASPFHFEATPGAGGEVRAAEVLAVGGGVRAVVTLGLETYVAGVLAGEGATLRSPGAREAMAVIARTWAVRSRGRHRARGFDFCSLTHCQHFRLASGPSDAAEKTAGLVLKHQGQPIDAYYSAHCGGVTEAAGDVWPDRAAPYLESVADPYCA